MKIFNCPTKYFSNSLIFFFLFTFYKKKKTKQKRTKALATLQKIKSQ